ncbi:hypothetical protein KAU08_07400 [bacterium]|nr:hypothetical protein [bacterium]
MRRVIFLTLILTLCLNSGCGGSSIGTPEIASPWPPERPVLVQAPVVDQETIDWLRFLMGQPQVILWDEMGMDRDVLWGGVSAIYFQALEEKNKFWINVSINVMGGLGYVEFLPLLIDALENPDIEDTSGILYSVGTMPSAYSIFVLTNCISNEGQFVREGAIYGLQRFKYYDLFPGTRTQAVKALMLQREVEQSGWLLMKIDQALEVLSGDD